MDGPSHVLPSQHACTAVGQLRFDKAAFILLASLCEHERLGVLTDTVLLKALCDVSQAMNGRN